MPVFSIDLHAGRGSGLYGTVRNDGGVCVSVCVCGCGVGGVFVFLSGGWGWVCLSACVHACVFVNFFYYYFFGGGGGGGREKRKDSADSHLSRQLDTHPRVRTTLASVAVRTLASVQFAFRAVLCSPFTSVTEPRSAEAFQTKLKTTETKMTFSNSLLF